MRGTSFPLKVGGIYPLTGREPLALRVTEIVGETVFYVHHEEDGSEFGPRQAEMYIVSQQLTPEDIGPLPKIAEALRAALEHLDSGSPAPHAAIEKIQEALRWTA
jgi:hypothetical protein